MATVDPKQKAIVAYTMSGGTPTVRWFVEGTPTWAGTTIAGGYGMGGRQDVAANTSTGYLKAGALVCLNGTYGLDVPRQKTTSATGAYVAAATKCVGILLADCNGTATHKVPVAIFDYNNVFMASVASTTSAATATVSKADVYLKACYGASLTASLCYPNTTNSATASFFKAIGKYEGDDWGDRYGRIYFQCLPAKTQFPQGT